MTPTRTFVMTGATRGIGRLAAAYIVSGNPDVHLVLLARGNADDIATELRGSGGNVTVITTDLSSPVQIRATADRIKALLSAGDLPPLAGIVANAGIQLTNALTETADGYEETFAVNVLANHVLIRSLSESLEAGTRITVTTSDTHFGDFRHNLGIVPAPVWHHPATLAAPGAFADPESAVAGRTAYSTSKLAVVHLVHAFARRLPNDVQIVSYNPGFVPGTGLARDANRFEQFIVNRVMPALTLTPIATTKSAAARHLKDTALGGIVAATGDYIDRGRVVRSSDESYDRAREDELWDYTEQLLADLRC
ncbi:SDR family NAD(P)-dependent oxidoreductase [Williamsia sp.]|uniref:SDR family NAD(P)-dependent oxidoreductase n=1 Tax=Williamsia sp. TaxID=1872085 RepID=UPI002F95C259